jgi:hypothetical protein
MVTQKQRLAIFGTRALVCATPLYHLRPHRNQIFLGGQHREACRLSPGLHRTSQQAVQVVV